MVRFLCHSPQVYLTYIILGIQYYQFFLLLQMFLVSTRLLSLELNRNNILFLDFFFIFRNGEIRKNMSKYLYLQLMYNLLKICRIELTIAIQFWEKSLFVRVKCSNIIIYFTKNLQ